MYVETINYKHISMTIKPKNAQLILVAHAAHVVSVKFFNWEEFFPIEYV